MLDLYNLEKAIYTLSAKMNIFKLELLNEGLLENFIDNLNNILSKSTKCYIISYSLESTFLTINTSKNIDDSILNITIFSDDSLEVSLI